MSYFRTDDPAEDRENFDIEMTENPSVMRQLYQLLQFKEKDVSDNFEEDYLDLQPFEVPIEILPRKYAIGYDAERGEVTFKFCGLRYRVSNIFS